MTKKIGDYEIRTVNELIVKCANQNVCSMFPVNVFCLKTSNGRMKNNNYIISDPVAHKAVAVDPAWEQNKIEGVLAEKDLSLDGILLTHSHFDHIHLAKTLAAKHQCPIWMSETEINDSGFRANELVSIDERRWNIGNIIIDPILTPGHTPGCICYLIDNCLFSGDVLFVEGCGICPDEFQATHMYNSLQKLHKKLKPDTQIFPGHTYGKPPGKTYSLIQTVNIYLQFQTVENFVAYRMRSSLNLKNILNFN